ncbi:MAG TPA: DinB family protein [Longimicrobiales bacterium]|nr:DinB family protein [Longimicrobiales bacterium]
MDTHAIPLDEFDQEMATTRRLLERVPDDQGEWRPHKKSFPLAHLAQLVSSIPSWIARTLRTTELSLDEGPGYSIQPTSALISAFDKNVREAREALETVTGKDLEPEWSLKSGEHVLYSAPRGAAARGHLNHLIHHRGQLTVYLRLLDVPLPSIYGPTADEKWGESR